MTTRDIVFVVVGAITGLSALLAVTTRHVVHAALWLLVALGSLAGCYIVLGQELVGLVQLLVYVGAIVVLVLFALMLTRAPIGPKDEIDTPRWQRAAAVALGAGLTALIATLVIPVLGSQLVDLDGGAAAAGQGSSAGATTPGIARAIFGTWVWPFELLSVLLLVALIGAFAVSRLVLGSRATRVTRATGAGDSG
ncbi:MAG: NADH-quinone oxidoreductase subunit J [Micrococcales bacterium]|nr:NADH-quinone oxidoreductase subunit J [Micrococcales bacterium]